MLHPKVADAAVFGIPHDDWGEEVKAVVEPAAGVGARPGRSSRSCSQFLSDRLAKYKIPRTIDFIDEMPRDPNGKLYKRKLRDPYWAGKRARDLRGRRGGGERDRSPVGAPRPRVPVQAQRRPRHRPLPHRPRAIRRSRASAAPTAACSSRPSSTTRRPASRARRVRRGRPRRRRDDLDVGRRSRARTIRSSSRSRGR